MNPRTLLLLTTAALLPLAACSDGSRAAEETAPRGLAVRTATVEKRDLPEDVVLTGTLKPRSQVQVVAEVQARLLRVLREEGARVAKGDVLAVLDDTDYRLANDRARAALAVAEANRAHAQAEKERADNLVKTGGITDRDHLAAQVAQQVAEAGLAQARAEAAIAAQQLARTQVRAPFAGRVAKRFPDAGAMIAAGGTTSAPDTCPTRTAARAKRPPTRSARPGTSTTTWNERERSSTSGSMRTMRPWARDPESASIASSTAAPTFTFA
jgi:multidrug efflux pump subunit AcrA (membrane-fusion protein)